MIKVKKLPLAVAVATSLISFSSLAETENNNTQLEELTKRIQELETKVQETDYIYDQQPAVLTPDFEPPAGLVFSGYARYGAHYADSDAAYVEVGSSGRSVGRLGNEYNGGEVQLARAAKTDSGMLWDVVVMFDQWGNKAWGSEGGVNLKKMYAGATNIFESQPELYLWAGRDFHQRPQQGLNDYFWMTHDGQGGGFNNLTLGGIKLDMGFVGQVDSATGALGNDNGKYALTSKLHGIDLGIGNLDLYANYGFASKQAGEDLQDEKAWQVGAVLGLGASNKFVFKYADGADDSVFDLAGDKKVIYASLEGGVNPSSNLFIDYLASYKKLSGENVKMPWEAENTERSEYSAIVRPMYNWDEVHSTWLEAGYAMEDHVSGFEKKGWKVTLSQNVSMGGLPWSRPMLRFYVTAGDVTASEQEKVDTLTAGAMFEAWW
ncbi:carbohydrate porin [Vibrio hangzhouensis]|uniref:Maltoporin n=1 Tax=Vibrio hangzhouensis TaxID=462991 RepID=A0A1H5VBF4_9VIBR|nr:carbohydrate porin [Vibrio hangzhouensis]SEF84543.1 maltoporin [Vibrio hangzhouensis]